MYYGGETLQHKVAGWRLRDDRDAVASATMRQRERKTECQDHSHTGTRIHSMHRPFSHVINCIIDSRDTRSPSYSFPQYHIFRSILIKVIRYILKCEVNSEFKPVCGRYPPLCDQ